MSDVFISYASEDRTRAKLLAKTLEASGFSVWWDRKIVAGQSYDKAIEHELDTAESVVVLWSKHSVASEWVKNEAQVAMERGRLVPALIDDVRPPLEFRRKQSADLIGWNGDVGHAGFEALHRGISAHVARELPTQTSTQHLKRKHQWHALLWAGAAALLILAMAGLWIWDAFYRPHTDYYANVITRWGVPEGIGQLSSEQVRHRNFTLAFLKHGRRKPVKEIRAVNSRSAYPPEFASSSFLALEKLSPFSVGTVESMNTIRVTFEYDNNDRIVKQSAYDRSDRLLYMLHYPQPNIAEYKWEVFSRIVSESGITHIKFVRPETGPGAGLNKDVLFLDSAGTPRPDRGGQYGYRSLFDKRGLVLESIPLGVDAQPTPNRLGVAKAIVERDELGNLTKLVRFALDGQPVLDQTGSAEMRMLYDQYGNNTEVAFFDADSQLVTSAEIGAAGRTSAYDDRGNIIENIFFGPDRQLVIGPLGFAKQKIVWDENGGSLESYFGPDGKLVPIAGRFFKIRGIWDERGRLVEAAYLDENDRPIRNALGCAKTRMGRDERGNIAETVCFDEGDQPVRDTSGAARAKRKFDQRGNKLEATYFGPGGQLELYEERYVKTQWKYDPQGKVTEEAYFDAANKSVRNRDGYAKVTYEYDLYGNRTEVVFFDENGQPTARKGGYAKIVRTYDARQNLIEEILLETEGRPVRSENGYAKTRFAYDARGYRIETSYYDERDRPTAHQVGCTKIRNHYNDKGQWTERACFGLDGSLIIGKKYGYAKARRIFDIGGRLLRVDFFDADGDQTRCADGYARVKYSWDEFGRETKREFFDVNGEPVLTRVLIDKVESGSKSQRVGLQAGDAVIAYDGQEIADDRRFNELELMAGDVHGS